MVVSSLKGDIYEENLEELEERRQMYKKIRGKDNVAKEMCFKMVAGAAVRIRQAIS
jgi:hypothetical protein